MNLQASSRRPSQSLQPRGRPAAQAPHSRCTRPSSRCSAPGLTVAAAHQALTVAAAPQASQSLQPPGPHSRCSAPGAPHSCCSPPHLTVAAAPQALTVAAAPRCPSQSLQRPTVTPDPRGWVRTPVRTEAGRRRATTGAGGVSCLNVLPKCSAKCSA